jgi:peptidoglycan/xylan/chitin deacetylase (PgdA/CDA1 family)
MREIALCYHDVFEGGEPDSSGFPGPSAALYKLDAGAFGAQLGAIAESAPRVIADVRAPGEDAGGNIPLVLTFDDGGSGALVAADLLERRGWRGHFLITTGCIGTRGFLDRGGVSELRRRGHVVGSHSVTHPGRMSSLAEDAQRDEWEQSLRVLTDILGERVDVASVPGGYYSRLVARTAAASGIRALFTSEPGTRIQDVDGCIVIGRYAVQRGMSVQAVACIASGNLIPRARQSAFWNAKKVAKTLGGENYLKIRRWIIARRGNP